MLPVIAFCDLRTILIADSLLEMGARAGAEKSAKVWRSSRVAVFCLQWVESYFVHGFVAIIFIRRVRHAPCRDTPLLCARARPISQARLTGDLGSLFAGDLGGPVYSSRAAAEAASGELVRLPFTWRGWQSDRSRRVETYCSTRPRRQGTKILL